VTASKATTAQAGTPAASGYRSLSMPMRYLINALLVVVFLVVGELMIDGGVVSRYQTGVIEQIGIYIILAVSLNIATGYLGQLPLGHAGFMSVGGYSCAIFIMRMMDVVGVTARDFATGSPAAVGLFVLGIIFGGVCAAICGLIIGVRRCASRATTWPSSRWALPRSSAWSCRTSTASLASRSPAAPRA
jgi:branched-chain amino acid transport system permease protein